MSARGLSWDVPEQDGGKDFELLLQAASAGMITAGQLKEIMETQQRPWRLPPGARQEQVMAEANEPVAAPECRLAIKTGKKHDVVMAPAMSSASPSPRREGWPTPYSTLPQWQCKTCDRRVLSPEEYRKAPLEQRLVELGWQIGSPFPGSLGTRLNVQPAYYYGSNESAAAFIYSSRKIAQVVEAFSHITDREHMSFIQVMDEVIGDPWRKPTVLISNSPKHWSALTMAQTIYYENRLRDLPILADALEDADYPFHDVLEHFRRACPRCYGSPDCPDCGGTTYRRHLKGCWALDVVLGLE